MPQLAQFSDGEWTSLSGASWAQVASAVERVRPRRGFVWILLDDPDDEELATLGRERDLRQSDIRDVASDRQQPKIQAEGDELFVVLWALQGSAASGFVGITHLFAFIRAGLLLIVRRHAGEHAPDLRAVATRAFERFEPGVLAALYAVMSDVFEGYTAETDRIEDALEELETLVFAARSRGNVERMYRLRQQIGRVQRAVAGMTAALQAGQAHLSDLMIGDEEVDPHFRRLLDDLIGTNQLVTDQDRALDSVLESHQNNIAIQQNEDMRRISGIAALLSVPAVIASLYGMEFDEFPGKHSPLGWLAVMGVIVVIDLVVYVVFKRRHWL